MKRVKKEEESDRETEYVRYRRLMNRKQIDEGEKRKGLMEGRDVEEETL